MADHPNPDGIFQLGMGFWGSKTLLSAVELGLFTELAKGPQDVDGLAQALGLHQRSSRDFFDALVALGMLNREGGQYTNTMNAEIFLDRAKPSYIGSILEMANARLYGFWGSLTEALRTGQPQNEAKDGGNAFDAMYADPASLEAFVRSMTGVSMGANMAIAQKFPWANYQSFIDLGTAQGSLPVQIATANAHLSGGGLDLSPVGPIFEKYVASFGLSERLSFYAGDFFKEPLPKADVYLMGHILHDWSLEDKRMLIAKAYDALNPGGALVVYDAMIDDDRSKNAFGLLMSLNMLIETPEGFDYTGADCQSWLQDAGFHDTYVEHLVGPDSMAVGIK